MRLAFFYGQQVHSAASMSVQNRKPANAHAPRWHEIRGTLITESAAR